MNDESLEEMIRSAAPRQTPELLRARLASRMSAEAGPPRVSFFRRHRVLWPAMTAAAASLAFVFLWSMPFPHRALPRVAVQETMSPPPVLLRTCTLGRSESAGNVMVGNSPYQVTRHREINIREYADKTFGTVEVCSYSNVSYKAQPLVIR